MITTIIQQLDHYFTTMIFIPMLVILYCNVRGIKRDSRTMLTLYRISLALVCLFLMRYFCEKFIFTPVNYGRFADSGMFPLVRAIFYPGT